MAERDLGAIRGVVFDLDGTVYDDRGVTPGAAETLSVLRRRGLRICYATNTTRRPRRALVEHLREMSLDVSDEQLLTAPIAAVGWLRAHGVESVALHLAEATTVEFDEFARDDRAPDAVVVGDLGDGWNFERLNRAFRQVMAGATLIAVQRNRYWQTSDGLTLDAGPFVSALEYATGQEAIVVGKPAPAFFDAATGLLELPPADCVMVGDDVVSDVDGAMNAGFLGVLVRTGKFRPSDLDRGITPDAVIDSVADLLTLLDQFTAASTGTTGTG